MFGLQPDILILATGANDGLRGIDPGLTQRNIEEIIQSFLEKEVIVVLAGMTMVQNMGKDYTSAFQAIYPTAQRHQERALSGFSKKEISTLKSLLRRIQGGTMRSTLNPDLP